MVIVKAGQSKGKGKGKSKKSKQDEITDDVQIGYMKPEINFVSFTKRFHQDLHCNKNKLPLLQEYVTLKVNGIHMKDSTSLTKIKGSDAIRAQHIIADCYYGEDLNRMCIGDLADKRYHYV
jgi:hypothetical protein